MASWLRIYVQLALRRRASYPSEGLSLDASLELTKAGLTLLSPRV